MATEKYALQAVQFKSNIAHFKSTIIHFNDHKIGLLAILEELITGMLRIIITSPVQSWIK